MRSQKPQKNFSFCLAKKIFLWGLNRLLELLSRSPSSPPSPHVNNNDLENQIHGIYALFNNIKIAPK